MVQSTPLAVAASSFLEMPRVPATYTTPSADSSSLEMPRVSSTITSADSSSLEMPRVSSTITSAASSSLEMPTSILSVIVSETPATAINPAAQPSITFMDTPHQFNIIIGVGIGSFVFGILVSAIVMIVVTLACRIKKNILADNVAAHHECVKASDNSEGKSGSSTIYSLWQSGMNMVANAINCSWNVA